MSLNNSKTSPVYHRFLRVPYDPGIDFMSKPLRGDLKFDHIHLEDGELNPDLIRWFNEHDIAVPWHEAFYNAPDGGGLPIHTDTAEISDIAKFIWSYGAPGSKMIWWEVDDPAHILELKTLYGVPFFQVDERYCHKIFEQEITQPSLVNVGHFHSSHNPSTEKRWTLSLLLFDLKTGRRLVWDEAYERLRDYIIEPDDVPGAR